MLAGLLVLVLLLMQQAQRAENYHWLWYLQGQPVPEGQEADPDTRVRHQDVPRRPTSEFGPLITGAGTDRQPADLPTQPGSPIPEEPSPVMSAFDQARTDAWAGLLHGLEDPRRREFLQGLRASRNGQPIAEENRSHWPDLVAALDQGWQRYVTEARSSLDDEQLQLTEDERVQWLDVLSRLQQHWQQQAFPALSGLMESAAAAPEHQAAIARIQADLDQVFLRSVRDNTVFRPAEMDAWFRLLERLARDEWGETQTAPAPVVSFGQLFKQPEVYRGRLVTVEGTVRRVEFMEAPENFYGIGSYFRLWLQPVGSNSPIVIYSLEIPEGFPAMRIAQTPDSYLDLEESVRITGFFFKRWPYSARDGTRLAPVLLSRTFAWTPGLSSLADPDNLPRPAFWIVLFSGTAVLGIAIAWSVYRFSGRSTPLALRNRLTSASKKGPAP
jgi:hypothetical protein